MGCAHCRLLVRLAQGVLGAQRLGSRQAPPVVEISVSKRMATGISHKLLAVAAAACCAVSAAAAEQRVRAPNARVAGDLAPLNELAESHVASACHSPPCFTKIRPIRLHMAGAKSGRISIVLDTVRESPPVEGNSASGLSSRPLILRGHTTRRAASRTTGSRAHPDAVVVLFRDSKPFTIEVSVLGASATAPDPSQFTIARAQLGPSGTAATRNARIQAASHFASRELRCPHSDGKRAASDPASGAPVAQPQAGRYDVLYLATDYDPQFAQVTKCGKASACKDRIVATVAQASLFYESRFGLVLEVARQYGPNRHGTTEEASEVLGAFVDFNNERRSRMIHDGKNKGKNLVDLFMLFTGKQLLDDVYGLTYLSIACRDEFSDVADMVVQHVSDSLDPSNIAHHIGHTLSASHTTSGIMKPDLREPAPTSWAPASFLEISSYLNTFYQSCRTGRSDGVRPPTPTPTATPTPDPFAGVPRTLALKVSKSGPTEISVQTTLSEVIPNCLVSIRVAAGPTRAKRGVLVKQFTPGNFLNTALVNMPYGIDMAQEHDPDMHFFAEYVCRNNKRAEVSAIKVFDANERPTPRRRVSKKRWIDLLVRAFK